MYEYGENFYRYLSEFARSSAKHVIPVVTSVAPIHSVVDFGCGLGGWLSAWKEAGATVTGLDGGYIDRRYLMIDQSEFIPTDLDRPINLGRTFDLVQSLEVAEHLSPDSAGIFIDSLVAHGRLVMFSAALPGQGGEHHINERPMEYWRELFRSRDYVAVDYIRPMIQNKLTIQHWYRYNIILYVHKSYLNALPQLQDYLVPANKKLRNMWPAPYRIQHQLQALLPPIVIDSISRCKAAFIARRVKNDYRHRN